MKFRILALCMTLGCLLLFTGCEPNVDNNPSDTTISTTSKPTTEATTSVTTPEGTVTDTDTVTDTGTEAVGDETSTATFLNEIPIEVIPVYANLTNAQRLSRKKICWGPGKETDDLARPRDAVSAQEKYSEYDAFFIDVDYNEEIGTKRIYLTFDEGYENGYTPQILDILNKYNVKATFFITYDYAKRASDLVLRMIEEGHAVGNHSYTHPSFPELSSNEVRDEIGKLHDYILQTFGYEMELIRFPKGEFSEETLAVAQEMGYKSIFWSAAHVDWDVNNQPNLSETYDKLTKSTHPGEILLLHAVSKTNAECLESLILYWCSNGYKLSLF